MSCLSHKHFTYIFRLVCTMLCPYYAISPLFNNKVCTLTQLFSTNNFISVSTLNFSSIRVCSQINSNPLLYTEKCLLDDYLGWLIDWLFLCNMNVHWIEKQKRIFCWIYRLFLCNSESLFLELLIWEKSDLVIKMIFCLLFKNSLSSLLQRDISQHIYFKGVLGNVLIWVQFQNVLCWCNNMKDCTIIEALWNNSHLYVMC